MAIDESTVVIRFNKEEINFVQGALGAMGALGSDLQLIRERIRQRLDMGAALLRDHEPAQAGPAALALVGVAPLSVKEEQWRAACECGYRGAWYTDHKFAARSMNRHFKLRAGLHADHGQTCTIETRTITKTKYLTD